MASYGRKMIYRKTFRINNWKEHDYLNRDKLWITYHRMKNKLFKFYDEHTAYSVEFEFVEFSQKFRPFKKHTGYRGVQPQSSETRDLLDFFYEQD